MLSFRGYHGWGWPGDEDFMVINQGIKLTPVMLYSLQVKDILAFSRISLHIDGTGNRNPLYYGRQGPAPRFNIKMTSYQCRKSHCGDKTVVRSSYLHNGISYTGKTTSLYWIGALVFPGMGISIIKIRESWDCIPFIMGIPILLRHLLI